MAYNEVGGNKEICPLGYDKPSFPYISSLIKFPSNKVMDQGQKKRDKKINKR